MNLTPAIWEALSTLFDEALDLDAEARAAWIEHIDATRPELGPLLRRLLAAHGRSDTADVLRGLPQLNAPAVGGLQAVAGLAVGVLVGPYRLTREIGSGGMAEVWLAERADGAFNREVALKLPRITRLRRDLAARFGQERDLFR